jgi:hypothetical protein
MPGDGLKIDLESGAESALTFDDAMDAMDAMATFVDKRVLVSFADRLGNACASVFGVMKRRLEVGEESQTGALSVFDVGVDGLVILSRAAFVGARWLRDPDTFLALQNGEMLLTVRRHTREVS